MIPKQLLREELRGQFFPTKVTARVASLLNSGAVRRSEWERAPLRTMPATAPKPHGLRRTMKLDPLAESLLAALASEVDGEYSRHQRERAGRIFGFKRIGGRFCSTSGAYRAFRTSKRPGSGFIISGDVRLFFESIHHDRLIEWTHQYAPSFKGWWTHAVHTWNSERLPALPAGYYSAKVIASRYMADVIGTAVERYPHATVTTFVDDVRIDARCENEAMDAFAALREKLQLEGLQLNPGKQSRLPTSEFLRHSSPANSYGSMAAFGATRTDARSIYYLVKGRLRDRSITALRTRLNRIPIRTDYDAFWVAMSIGILGAGPHSCEACCGEIPDWVLAAALGGVHDSLASRIDGNEHLDRWTVCPKRASRHRRESVIDALVFQALTGGM